MTQLFAIIKNSYIQTIRQPVYGIIVFVTLGGLALAPSLTGWTLDDDNKMLRDIGLSTLLIQGLFLACFAASGILSTEIDDKTVLTVVAKPISRPRFILGKYLGLLGALATAHWLAGIAFFMTLRHGVLQSAAETSDLTVIVLGPGIMLLLAIAATVFNILYEWRFLPTLIALSLPFLTLSTAILLAVDRDWHVQTYEVTQTMDNLPPEVVDSTVFRGIIEFRPLQDEQHLTGHRGHLVRKAWQGPISEADEQYLADLSDAIQWKKDVNFLAQEARKLQGIEIFKAGLLIFVALAVLAAAALAASARIGILATFLVCFILLAVGLSADQVLKPLAEANAWAEALYRVIPNFQCFWMVDALSENRVIPWGYVVSATGYGILYAAAMLALGIALFETREVG
jgi:hypothetical protein